MPLALTGQDGMYGNPGIKAQAIALDDRNGSKPDERGHRPEGPHLGVKQTKSGAKQTLPLEGLLSGVERSDRRHGPNSRL